MKNRVQDFSSNRKTLIFLLSTIAVLAGCATSAGIFSSEGPGEFNYKSIRGKEVTIYGEGIYRHMSAEVAIQRIAQDDVTLCIGIPLLLISLYFSLKGSLRWLFVLSGTIAYFLVTYLFYLTMATYNEYFLAYAGLLGTSFFALALSMLSIFRQDVGLRFDRRASTRFVEVFSPLMLLPSEYFG